MQENYLDIKLGEFEYRINKIQSLFTQANIARRLLALIKNIKADDISDAVIATKQSKEANFEQAIKMVATILPRLIDGISSLPDEDFNYIVSNLLQTVYRKQEKGTGWAKIISGKDFMFSDIRLDTILKLSYEVIKFHFKDLFPDLASTLNQPKLAPSVV